MKDGGQIHHHGVIIEWHDEHDSSPEVEVLDVVVQSTVTENVLHTLSVFKPAMN